MPTSSIYEPASETGRKAVELPIALVAAVMFGLQVPAAMADDLEAVEATAAEVALKQWDTPLHG